jgi:hypothetical protein
MKEIIQLVPCSEKLADGVTNDAMRAASQVFLTYLGIEININVHAGRNSRRKQCYSFPSELVHDLRIDELLNSAANTTIANTRVAFCTVQ